MSKMIDLTGMRFERLVVTGIVGRQDGKLLWRCVCDCGKERNVLSVNLKSGRQKSCGCKNDERIVKHGALKGGLKTPEWRAWQNIKKRCYYEKDEYYYMYGAAGIKVCDRWLDCFENFLSDMGKRPTNKHSIDRINGNKDYGPDNCRWATGTEQIINQPLRKDNTSGYKGVSWEKNCNKWFAYISPGRKEKRIKLGYFESLQDAIEVRKQAELKYHALAK